MFYDSRLGRIRQVAYVVPDVNAAAELWVRQFGAGPFFLMPDVRFPGWTYRGRPQDLPVDLMLGQLAGNMIEFIRPHSAEPSVYSHAMADRPVLHHYGLLVDDLVAATALIDDAVAVTTGHSMMGTPFTYNDTRATLGVMVELIEARPDVVAIFDHIADASLDWDGREPIRSMPGA